MSPELPQWLPPQGVQIGLVLFLSFLIGLEREEHKAAGAQYSFGGVRSFPLIGLIGYALAVVSGPGFALSGLGLGVVAAFLLLSYWHKLSSSRAAGVTSELSGLATYIVGALVFHEQYWIATAISVASLLLLELKERLEGLAQHMAPQEILTFTQFLLITAVILPILPNQGFTSFQLNPYKAWLAVVAVSAVSYGSYVCLKLSKGQGSVLLTAILGGAYSSTVTTIALARQAEGWRRPNLVSGAVLLASGIMYLRLLVLVALFNADLCVALLPTFLGLAVLTLVVGGLWSRRADPESISPEVDPAPRNPLELGAALLFGALFLTMMTATHYVAGHLGTNGVLTLAGVMGVSDVDPFILGLTQSAGTGVSLQVAASAIVVAAASNNLVKGGYVYFMADSPTGRKSLFLLGSLAVIGVVPLLWI